MRLHSDTNKSFKDYNDDSTEDSFLAALEGTTPVPTFRAVSASDLHLINKKIPIRYCEYKITNCASKMLQTTTISISAHGTMFHSTIAFQIGTLIRILVELPDYWARKSKHVQYRHTSAPTHFQILARVAGCEDIGKRGQKFQMILENVNMDPVDETVLREFLGIQTKNTQF